jgi:glycine cleavage system H lipoate-binding protein
MDVLLSQLAQTAAKERALLEECGDLLSVAATLEVEECSLRTHLIQLESEKGWSSATLPMSGRTITPNHE